MRNSELISGISGAMEELKRYTDELRDLDTALGDGDLGVTVSLGADAVMRALAASDPEQPPAETIRTCAKVFANANPSTMAALVAGALLAGSRKWDEKTEISTADTGEFMVAAAESISRRGKTQLGDKTILDVLVPAANAVSEADPPERAIDDAIAAAAKAVVETTPLQSRRGRASWLQERSIGLQDPGATALLRLLESWKAASSVPIDARP